ncbi:MAG TPA: hypothetical protein VHC94_19640 [Nitrobacter sp.]|jgi:hypothetical protein|nr:hypothetical protein [Nitrobacter sp.]
MTCTKFLAAAAVLASMTVSPVLAQDMSQPPTTHERLNHHRTYGSHAYDRHYGHRDNGFWPADVAAGVVGGAIGAAGAVATAPFRDDAYASDRYAYDDRYAYNDAYAYDNGDYMNDGQKASGSGGPRYSDPYSYSARNGFICQPGTLVRLEDGAQHICQ